MDRKGSKLSIIDFEITSYHKKIRKIYFGIFATLQNCANMKVSHSALIVRILVVAMTVLITAHAQVLADMWWAVFSAMIEL